MDNSTLPFIYIFSTRLHSSRIRTARTLTVSPSTLCSGEVYLVPGVYLVLGGVLSPGGCLLQGRGGCTWSWGGGTWSCGGVPGPMGVSALGGVHLVPEGGVCSGGAAPWGGCTWSWGGTWSGTPLPVDRMTHASENITLPQTSFADGNYGKNPKDTRMSIYNCAVLFLK